VGLSAIAVLDSIIQAINAIIRIPSFFTLVSPSSTYFFKTLNLASFGTECTAGILTQYLTRLDGASNVPGRK